MFWRNPTAAFFGFLLPLLLLAMFGAVFSGEQDQLDVVVPGIAGMSVMAATFVALAYNLVFLRERGILKRLRGTPLPSSAYLAGIAANAITNTVLQVAVVIVAGRVFFGIPWPGDWFALLVFLAAGVVCFASLGVALSHAIPNSESAPAYVNAVFLPMIMLAGVFYDDEDAPAVLRDLAEAMPLKHLIDGLSGAMVNGEGLGRPHGGAGGAAVCGRPWAWCSRCVGSRGRRGGTDERQLRWVGRVGSRPRGGFEGVTNTVRTARNWPPPSPDAWDPPRGRLPHLPTQPQLTFARAQADRERSRRSPGHLHRHRSELRRLPLLAQHPEHDDVVPHVAVPVPGAHDALAPESDAFERDLGAAVARVGPRGQAVEAQVAERQGGDHRLRFAVDAAPPPLAAEPRADRRPAVARRQLRQAGDADRARLLDARSGSRAARRPRAWRPAPRCRPRAARATRTGPTRTTG